MENLINNMETVKKVTQQVNLVEGMFTPSEALDVVQALIDQKINFHKIQRLSWREGHDNCNTEYPDGRIAELMEEKKKVRAYINELRANGNLIKIDGRLSLTEVKI